MKYVNFYSGTALALIASLLGSLGAATGEMAPPLIVGALLFTVLVLGWAGGASDSRHELDRLTRLEAGRQLQMTCNAAARDRLEEANIALHAYLTDCQAAIEVFTAAQAGTMVRITALEGENAELRKRPSSEVMIETAVRLMRENSADEDSDEEYLNGRAAGIAHMHTELVQHMMASTPAAMNSHPSLAAGAAADDMAVDSFAADIKAKLATGSAAGGGGWNDPAQCSIEHLQGVLVEWVAKGDPVSVGALAMMIHQRGGRTALAQHQQNALLALLALQPLVEPVYIGKALMAHREARVVLDGGTGPKAAVFLVNISLTSWTYTKETAEAYARGWNSGVRALRGALTEAVVGKLLPVALGDSK